jgi:putative endonuclease
LIDPPVGIVYSEKLETFPDARKREAQVKRWTRAKKEALIDHDLEKLKLLSRSNKKREI